LLAYEDKEFSVTSVYYVITWYDVTRDRGQYQTLATCRVRSSEQVSNYTLLLFSYSYQRVSHLHPFKSKSVTADYYHTYHSNTDLLLSFDIDYYRLMPVTVDYCRDALLLGHSTQPLLYSHNQTKL